MQKAARLKRELQVISSHPPPGISCSPKDDKVDVLEASIIGMQGSPYEGGLFKLEIKVPDKYPFEPPHIQFKTPVYHPNIDVSGRICLDLLKLPPSGAWRPVISLSALLMAIQLLLANPNPDDPLMSDIAGEYRENKLEYERKAREWTKKHASPQVLLESHSKELTVETEDVPSVKKRKSEESIDSERDVKCRRSE